MSSAANNQAYGNWNSSYGGGSYRGRWGEFHWNNAPPWFPSYALKPVLIVAMILGFVFCWPIGLALLAFLIISRHACGGWRHHGAWQQQGPGAGPGAGGGGGAGWGGGGPWQRWRGPGNPPSSGNRAFDEYRAETLRRLEDEQKEFGEFLDRLRFAKDKAEFDQFMNERRNRPPEAPPAPETPPQGPQGQN